MEESSKTHTKVRGFSRLQLWLFQTFMIVLIPVFFIMHLRQGATVRRFIERLGADLTTKSSTAEDKQTIWFHAASLGEVKQIQNLTEILYNETNTNILVTTFTQAGANWVAVNMPFASHNFAPLDIRWCVSRFLHRFSPKALVIVEGDIWPIMLDSALKAEVPMALLNARNSKSRTRFSGFHTKATSHFDLITCSNEAIQAELIDVGAPINKIARITSLKASKQTPNESLVKTIKKLANGRLIITFASTHASDEAMLADVMEHISSETTLLIWAPRHGHRLAAVSQILKDANLSYYLRSELDNTSQQCDALILDTLGELSTILSISNKVYLGGGLGAERGHNPFEPAQFGVPIATGHNVENHKQAFDTLATTNSITFVRNATELSNFIVHNHTINNEAISAVEDCFNQSIRQTIAQLDRL